MDWSPTSATNAYLDALKLCRESKKECNSCEEMRKLESNEFISALAAGLNSKLIVEVTSEASSSTVALAAAARQTGGKLLCILPDPRTLDKSLKVIQELGLNEMVKFRTGDPIEVLPNYENIDFSLVDCNTDKYGRLFEKLDVNRKRSIVVANNLVEGRKGAEGLLKGVETMFKVQSTKRPIGKGMEVTMIGKSNEFGKRERSRGSHSRAEGKGQFVKKTNKSKWVFAVDEKNGEEHIYRMPKSL
ncbi:Hypothetical predicted protein [Olea europaea subsp. europaea]|uniref:S-adenosyl-L-methionine-dependent methyltransferase n=1 Tax=Olea europaea subsp. europaea TaxID=158383 RepID=A0A8S0T2K3_OLEEU|nr:Hypothetical predicted protein [Olea europaea subsp. europaea]